METTPNILSAVLKIKRGEPLPLGSSITPHGINFALYSKHATKVTLVLFITGEEEELTEIPLDGKKNKTGHIWHICIEGINMDTIRYGFRVGMDNNPNPNVFRYNYDHVLVDPYAKALSGGSNWGQPEFRHGEKITNEVSVRKRRSIIIDDEFDWGDDRQLNTPLHETIIYELHVRGFTQHESSGADNPGTFIGLTEKIPYLKELGVTAVEFLPVYEFEETDSDRTNPETGEKLLNYWGYHPINFFAPKASYAASNIGGLQVKEFKQMVKTFHEAGIEVILDVVFNHTAEGNELGYTYSYRGIDNPTYYIIEKDDGEYHNYSGCGNTFNCNQPVVRDMILDALRYWVMEMHVDGFRFDLASILGRASDGSVLSNPPLLERIAHDPVLANTKLIAEAWDAAGLYQVGSFPSWGRWAEWNGKFRDDIRKFVKSDAGMTTAIAQRLIGSPDIYSHSGRTPYHSINFITSHDGFTMADLVSYNDKHNMANGEDNRDGDNHNSSWNCGVEGPTNDPAILKFRRQQQKNFATLLFLSVGTPMMVAGDELGRTQKGNNNAYCQDNEISWMDWNLFEKNAELFRFFKLLIKFRKQHPLLNFRDYASHTGEDVHISYHGKKKNHPNFSWESRVLGFHVSISDCAILRTEDSIRDIYIMMNAHWEDQVFELPDPCCDNRQWYRCVDTHKTSPDDILESPILLENQKSYFVVSRSIVVLVSYRTS